MDPILENPVRYCEFCGHYVTTPCSSYDSFEACRNVYYGDASGEVKGEDYVEVPVTGRRYDDNMLNKPYAPINAADDVVNIPNHYALYKIEPITFIMENDLPFAEGNVVKYTMRHKYKNGVEDLQKAIKYLKFIAKQTYGVEL